MTASSLFQVSPTSGVPIYRQLMDQVRALVASGRLSPGQRLPTVRDVGEALQINPMTVSKAWSLLEREGLIEHIRGTGMQVRDRSPRGTLAERQALLQPAASQLAATAFQLMLTRDQVLEVLTPLLDDLAVPAPEGSGNDRAVPHPEGSGNDRAEPDPEGSSHE